jgi:hypothetical protein
MGDIFDKLGLGGKEAVGVPAGGDPASVPGITKPEATKKPDLGAAAPALMELFTAGQDAKGAAPSAGVAQGRGSGVAADASFGPKFGAMPMPGGSYADGGATETTDQWLDRIFRDRARNPGRSVDPKGWAAAPTNVLANIRRQMLPDDPKLDYLNSILSQRIRSIFEENNGMRGDADLPVGQTPGMADGGMAGVSPALMVLLQQLARQGGGSGPGIGYQQGPGDGRSDSIQANLADGEFVIPSDVVAAIGNGSSNAGGRALGKMVTDTRQDFRSHLGKLPKPKR